MKPSVEQIAKLPKWAQEYIADLASTAARALERLAELRDGAPESSISIPRYDNLTPNGTPGQNYRVPGHHVEFILPTLDGTGKTYTIDVGLSRYSNSVAPERKGKTLIVCGEKELIVRPVVTNVVEIHCQ